VRKIIIEALNASSGTSKPIVHKIANLAVEIQGAMQEHENEAIW
jgi:hypothetical protein